ncbi:LLM class flavin-dependent oxidoreductase [Streptomyces sp. NPDC006997]|uniref:LLM class flavin-dependent oxidoreductase n=1 Tax=Streptomyces sp. NPDC006997 TaxID=3155356 RepID=UPI0033CD53C8
MTYHVGVQLPVNSIAGERTNPDLGRVARHAELLGLDSVWVGDRLSAGFPVLDPSLVLATAAAATERVEVGYGVMLLALRSAAWAAKQIGTLQHLSRGRVVLGVGVGSGDRAEWAAAGVPPQGRGRRTEELLGLLPGLLAGEPTALTDLPGRPTATLAPAVAMPPVWIGGGSGSALLRAVTHGQGWLASLKSPKRLAQDADQLERIAAERGVPAPPVGIYVFLRMTERAGAAATASAVVADRLGAKYGLDRAAASEIGLGGTPRQVAERLREYAEAGARRFVLVPSGADDDDPYRQYELFAEARSLLLAG